MKSYLSIVIVLLFASTSLIGQNLDCEKFKYGKFKILKDAIAEESILIRKGNLQTETLKGNDEVLEFVVNWTNKCTYTLTPTKKTMLYFSDLPKDVMLTVEIIETKENSYIHKSRFNFNDFETTGEVIKIE